MRKTDIEALAQAKFDDAGILLERRRSSNAYYLADYAVELALKACVAKQISSETIPDRDFIRHVFTHNFRELVALAGLSADLSKEQKRDAIFATNWGIASEWTPEARYALKQPMDAQLLCEAIGDPKSGVLQWIKKFW